MKKLFITALTVLVFAGALNAQNNFRGIVKYKLSSTGKVDVTIKPEQSEVEMKIFDDRVMVGNSIQNGLKQAQAIDFSQAIAYLAANDIELETYTGDGKMIVRGETTQAELDSLTLVDTEPGHFYYEYVDETKDILGYKAKKLVVHSYDEEGVDNPVECWYTEEIGPAYNLIIGNVKGTPLIYAQNGKDGRQITYTAIEIVKGKVKEAELLLPAGYKDVTDEEFETFMKELQDAASLLED